MKKLTIYFFIGFLAACGADTINEADRLTQFCEAQGMDAQLLHVTNVSTGETYLDVQCMKRYKEPYCKLGGC